MTTEFPPPPSLDFISRLSLPQLCGQLLVVGFEGTELPASLSEAIHCGLRGGVILFKRNLPDLETAWRLCSDIAAAFPKDVVPFIAIDQEGGRVCRLPPPCLTLPPMRTLGSIGDTDLTYRAATELGRQLSAIGITCNFAPVLDVDSNPQNPIIGDRSFSSDPLVVSTQAVAFAQGLENQGIAACGKHFPGHGDTETDSHLELPVVRKSRKELSKVELVPFREAIAHGLSCLMTAHVSYPGLDPSGLPATISPAIIGELLRTELEFADVLFSDDLEMEGIHKQYSVADAACLAVKTGCDALLICKHEHHAESALLALVAAAEADPAFSLRILEANMRFQRLRRRFPPRAEQTIESLRYVVSSSDATNLLDEIQVRLNDAETEPT